MRERIRWQDENVDATSDKQKGSLTREDSDFFQLNCGLPEEIGGVSRAVAKATIPKLPAGKDKINSVFAVWSDYRRVIDRRKDK